MYHEVFPSTKTTVLPGPFELGRIPPEKYEPVDCDFTDDLEYVSVKKIPVVVSHWGADSKMEETSGLINDIVSGHQEEVIVMSGGERVRLDKIFQLRIRNH